MKPRIHVITLAVGDLARALDFYRDGLGLETASASGTWWPARKKSIRSWPPRKRQAPG
jgi:catechol-2,3-dioxygenase